MMLTEDNPNGLNDNMDEMMIIVGGNNNVIDVSDIIFKTRTDYF